MKIRVRDRDQLEEKREEVLKTLADGKYTISARVAEDYPSPLLSVQQTEAELSAAGKNVFNDVLAYIKSAVLS